MPPFHYDENMKQNEKTSWYLDESKGYWQPISRKSSFSECKKLREHQREFRRHLRNEKKRIKNIESRRRYQERKTFPYLSWIWRHTFERIRDDWLCLALLGIVMALLSVGVDKGIELCSSARIWLYRDSNTSPALSYILWIASSTILILFAVTFVKILAPQSVGSGIPEVKTILRGFTIENHLTFNTLIAKLVGLTVTLGSGLSLGKEAPFVHISCIVARLLNKMMSSLRGTYTVDMYNTETLVAGCAVGISACFASPIGGVLYSIESTSTYFAVRNYWRAFFAAVCSAVVFRLYGVWSKESETITALFATNFTTDFPFDPQELFIFALIGAICGFLSSLWVWFFRQYSIFIKTNKFALKVIQAHFLLYPLIMVVVISFLTYPFGFCHVAGHLSTHDQMTQLFSNFTWSQSNLTEREANIVANWTNGDRNFIQTLIGYFIYTFLFSIIASTIAVPSGTFIPVLKLGACLGRLIGESIHLWFPYGVYFSERLSPVIPGGYAVVGAAAFAGGATHTISVAVMALEMTGQISLIAPIMISLLISNAIAVHLSPSIYDTIIALKKLPYVSELLPLNHEVYEIIVKSFMVKNIHCLWYGMSYSTLQTILMENDDLHHLPLVESQSTMILLGSVERTELIKIIARQISREKRLQVAAQWRQEAQDIRNTQEDELRARRPSQIEASDESDVTRPYDETETVMLSSVSWQDDGLKNRRPSRIDMAETGEVARLYNDAVDVVTTSSERKDEDIRHAPEATNSETITSNSSGYTILENVKDSTKLLRKSHSTISKTPNERAMDMSPRDQKLWEISQLNEAIHFDYEDIQIDPAPFQLVENTPISKIHRLFTILCLRRAYVTQLGRLVGVVGLKELRSAIEAANDGNFMIERVDIDSPSVSNTNSRDGNDDHIASDSVMNDVERAH